MKSGALQDARRTIALLCVSFAALWTAAAFWDFSCSERRLERASIERAARRWTTSSSFGVSRSSNKSTRPSYDICANSLENFSLVDPILTRRALDRALIASADEYCGSRGYDDASRVTATVGLTRWNVDLDLAGAILERGCVDETAHIAFDWQTLRRADSLASRNAADALTELAKADVNAAENAVVNVVVNAAENAEDRVSRGLESTRPLGSLALLPETDSDSETNIDESLAAALDFLNELEDEPEQSKAQQTRGAGDRVMLWAFACADGNPIDSAGLVASNEFVGSALVEYAERASAAAARLFFLLTFGVFICAIGGRGNDLSTLEAVFCAVDSIRILTRRAAFFACAYLRLARRARFVNASSAAQAVGSRLTSLSFVLTRCVFCRLDSVRLSI